MPRVTAGDMIAVALHGMRTRTLRVVLSTVGIAIGIAVMIAVIGISASSRAELLARIDALGTNLLTVSPARGHENDPAALPRDAPAMIRRIGPVQHASAVGGAVVGGRPIAVYRNRHVPAADTGGIVVLAARPDLLETAGASMETGRFLDAATDRYPTVVLGHDAAAILGIDLRVSPSTVWIADRAFTVIGILKPVGLTPELDRSVVIGFPEAADIAGPGSVIPTATIYVRVDPTKTPAVQRVLAPTTNPADPAAVSVGRPSDALAARAAADSALTGLLVGLGAVALIVGGLGIANVMVISVLERRGEIGLRRALGATRRQIALQFVTESIALSIMGGAAGVATGAALTVMWAVRRGWHIALPPAVLGAGLAAAVAIGAVAGLYPAGRAARLSPTDALSAP
jgi:putative ABC transport system permease protein